MKAIILNDEQRKRIIKQARPTRNNTFGRQNLNLLTAVQDEETGYILTMTYYLSAAIRRVDDNDDEYTYILLTDLGDYLIYCNYSAGGYKGIYSPLPMKMSNEKLEEMILYYDNSFSERRALEKKEEKKLFQGKKRYTDWYLETFFDGKESLYYVVEEPVKKLEKMIVDKKVPEQKKREHTYIPNINKVKGRLRTQLEKCNLNWFFRCVYLFLILAFVVLVCLDYRNDNGKNYPLYCYVIRKAVVFGVLGGICFIVDFALRKMK